MKAVYLQILVFLTTFFTLVGCASHRQEALQESIDAYALALRRGDLNAAVKFAAPEMREKFAENLRELNEFQVSHMEYQNITVDPDIKTATTTFLVELLSMNRSEISTLQRKFSWRYDDRLKSWQLLAENPLGGQVN